MSGQDPLAEIPGPVEPPTDPALDPAPVTDPAPVPDPVPSPDPMPAPGNVMLDQILASLVRTFVPMIVGLSISVALKAGIHITDAQQLWFTGFVTTLITLLYYAVVRFLETKFSSQWGWFLGWAKTPFYPPTGQTVNAHVLPSGQG